MSERIEANFNHELLIWARESIDLELEEAAKKIGIKTERLQDWESGNKKPTIIQLRKAASVYKRALAVFFLSEVPKTFDVMKDFRRLAEIGELKRSPHLLLEIRRSQYRREVALEVLHDMEEEFPPLEFHISITDNPENIAHKIRELLGISYEVQSRWRNSYEAFNSWKKAIENLNILVFHTSQTSRIEIEEMRGFSISENIFPAIVINSKDRPNGKLFTLLHELVHLVLHNGGICDLKEHYSVDTENQKTEIFCNHVSGATLVPMEFLLKNKIVIDKGTAKTWTDIELSNLASEFSVSREVILRRLLIADKTTEEFYAEKREEFQQYYQKSLETDREGFPPYYRMVIRNNGEYFIKMILNAYYQDLISSSQLSDFIGAKLSHLPEIEQALSRT